MSRLTPNEVTDLMEAYNTVYAPQELTEEQIWEEVENWVNSLLEEGYDLSDYTWEEMYEVYIEEQGRSTGGGAAATSREVGAVNKALGSAAGAVGSAAGAVGKSLQRANTVPSARPAGARQNLRGGGSRPATPAAKPATPAAKPTSAAPNTSKFAGARDAAFQKAQGIKGSPVVGSKPSAARPSAAPASRPSASTPAAKPAASTPAAPAGGKVSPKPAATPSAPSAPAKPSLSSQASELRQMRARSLERQGKTLSAATVSATAKPTAFQANSFDVFDMIKGHLLDEGYADTEEAALVIMANMSEEWKNSIIG
jgi:hypothetical protein